MTPRTLVVPAIAAALLALGGCTGQRPATPATDAVAARPPTTTTGSSQYQPANGPVSAGVSANPPDNPTGSQAYQSPDLDDNGTAYKAAPPRRDIGSQRYQRSR